MFDGLLTSTVPPLSQQIPPKNAYFSNEAATKSQHSLRHVKESTFAPPQTSHCL